MCVCWCTCVHARLPVCACAEARVCLALSHLSLKISADHCDFPPDYTPQLFNTFEDKRVCRVSHSQLFFFPPPPKRPPDHKHGNVTAGCKPKDQMFADESGIPRGPREAANRCVSWRRCLVVDIHRMLFVIRSHNSKTTTWLDPRLAKKAKPPEKCEDGGMSAALLERASIPLALTYL